MATTDPLEAIRSPALAVPHGFFGRHRGVSTGVAASLNVGLGAGDEPAAVAENRRRAAAEVLPNGRLVSVYQVHSARCVAVAEPWDEAARPEADALVTDRPGLVLGIVTADCAPVLFADRQAGVIGAAHAGWKGALGGVTEATLAAMEALGARRADVAAVIGPTIAQPSYEVDEGFAAVFMADDPGNGAHFAPGRPGHLQFDLPGYLLRRLRAEGCGRVDALRLDTYADAERFFSFRRATHRAEPTYGRQFSLIGIA